MGRERSGGSPEKMKLFNYVDLGSRRDLKVYEKKGVSAAPSMNSYYDSVD